MKLLFDLDFFIKVFIIIHRDIVRWIEKLLFNTDSFM